MVVYSTPDVCFRAFPAHFYLKESKLSQMNIFQCRGFSPLIQQNTNIQPHGSLCSSTAQASCPWSSRQSNTLPSACAPMLYLCQLCIFPCSFPAALSLIDFLSGSRPWPVLSWTAWCRHAPLCSLTTHIVCQEGGTLSSNSVSSVSLQGG